MARPIQFDRDDVLNKALGLFWSDGYEASSISQLLDVMGLNRGSLYSSFSDKSSLFKEVLEFYFQRISLLLLKPNLIEIDDPIESIRSFFYQALLYEDSSILSKGCFLFNTVSELSNTRPDLADGANDYLFKIRQMFAHRIEEAKVMGLVKTRSESGTIGNSSSENSSEKAWDSSEAQANYLMSVLAGLRIQCKMGFDRVEIKRTIDRALESLFVQP